MFLRIVLLLLFVSVLGCSSTPETLVPEAKMLTPIKGAHKFSPVWQTASGADADEKTRLTPVYSHQHVFVIGRGGKVVAINAANGEKHWTHNLNAEVTVGFTHDEHSLYAANDKGVVWALDKTTGKPRWQVNVSGAVLGPPLAYQGALYVRTNNGSLYALGTQNGQVQWKARYAPTEFNLYGYGSPTIINQWVVWGMDDGKLVAYDRSSGKRVWRKLITPPQTGLNKLGAPLSDVDVSPMYDGQRLYVASYKGRIAALNPNTGVELWKEKFSSRTDMAVAQGVLVAIDDLDRIYALDAATGKLKWRTGDLYARKLTAPKVAGKEVFVGDSEGYIHSFNLQTGKALRRYHFSSSGVASLVVIQNWLFAQAGNGKITAFVITE